MNGNSLLLCKRCGSILTQRPDEYRCGQCWQSYPIDKGIVLMEAKDGSTDLRIGDDILNVHKVGKERKYYDSIIKSEVEYYARLHSIDFANFHAELLSTHMSDSTVIVDLGCGQLPYVRSFDNLRLSAYYGLDLHRESLEIARDNSPRDFPLILVLHGAKNVPFDNDSVDITISCEVLEHLDKPKSYLREAHRILKKGGYLSLSTPCASMYFYPHNFLFMIAPKGLTWWYKKVNAHKYWKEALGWHPALRPKVLRKWVVEAGFSIIRHETRLWYYHTPMRLTWLLFSLLEKAGVRQSGYVFDRYLKFTDRLLSRNFPVLKWAGIRQFVLCQKQA